MSRAPFIVFEGIDRSGRKEICQQIVNKLRNTKNPAQFNEKFDPLLHSFPRTFTAVGWLLNLSINKDVELNNLVFHHLASANIWETKIETEEKLVGGGPVFAEPYVAYTSAKTIATGDLSKDWCQQFFTGLPKPDLTIFFDGTPVEYQPDLIDWEDQYDQDEFQQKINSTLQNNCDEDTFWMTVDTTGKTLTQIVDQLFPIILKYITSLSQAELPIKHY